MEKTSAEQEPAEKSSIYSKVSFSKAATTTSSFDPVENFVNRKSVIQEDDNNKKEKTGSKYKMKKKSGHMLVKHICELFGGKTAQLKAKVVKSKKTRKTDGFMSEGGYQYETDNYTCTSDAESISAQTPIMLRGRTTKKNPISPPVEKLSPKSQITRNNTLMNEAQSARLARETKEKAERLLKETRDQYQNVDEKILSPKVSPQKSRKEVLSPVRKKIAELEVRENCGQRYLRVLSPERTPNDCVCYSMKNKMKRSKFEKFHTFTIAANQLIAKL